MYGSAVATKCPLCIYNLDPSTPLSKQLAGSWRTLQSPEQCCRFSRNIGNVTPKIIYFYSQKKYLQDESIQKKKWTKTSLVQSCTRLGGYPSRTTPRIVIVCVSVVFFWLCPPCNRLFLYYGWLGDCKSSDQVCWRCQNLSDCPLSEFGMMLHPFLTSPAFCLRFVQFYAIRIVMLLTHRIIVTLCVPTCFNYCSVIWLMLPWPWRFSFVVVWSFYRRASQLISTFPFNAIS